jgi:hypothetical protein
MNEGGGGWWISLSQNPLMGKIGSLSSLRKPQKTVTQRKRRFTHSRYLILGQFGKAERTATWKLKKYYVGMTWIQQQVWKKKKKR